MSTLTLRGSVSAIGHGGSQWEVTRPHSGAQRAQARAIVAVEGQWRVRGNVCQIEEFRIRGMESLAPLTTPRVSRGDGEL
jgi:hypothetical protein